MAETKRARGAAARLAGLESPRRSFAGNSPGLVNPAFPGQNRSELGSGMLLTPCVIHWRQKGRRFGLGAGTSMAMAALGGGTSPECGVLVKRECSGLRNLEQRKQGV